MPVEILMPELGEGVHEGTVSRWLKQVGEFVKEDEPVVEIMTDKVNTELPAPASGTLVKILIQEGDPVGVFQAMGLIAAEGESAEAAPVEAPAPKAEPKPADRSEVPPSLGEPAPAAQIAPSAPAGKQWYSPVVRSIAREHKISDAELSAIRGSGAGGRVNKKDVEAYLAGGRSGPATAGIVFEAKTPVTTGPDQEIVALAGMRKQIAEHMVKSSAVPTVSTVVEVDVTNMVRLRDANKEPFQQTYGVKLTYTPFFIKSLADALVDFPMINASLREDSQLVMNRAVHIGVAVSLGKNGDEGLIVPVIRNCESKSIVDLARDLERIAARARSNSLGVPDIQGGTFTLSNPGSYGALFGTPMINAPQAAIAGTYGIQKVTKVVDEMIAIRSVMYLVLTYDHRIIDGLLAGRFLQSVKKRIEAFDFLE
jgi:pyruvate/2-oxoglutarate dehydrogenase complex dihydrolipoamide acyltransferase (E2) component